MKSKIGCKMSELQPIPAQATTFERESVGMCPKCGSEVYVNKLEYYCKNYSDRGKTNREYMKTCCFFTLHRNRLSKCGKEDITPDEMRILLQGKLITLNGLKRKDGGVFNTYGALEFKSGFGWGIGFRNMSAMSNKVR